MAAGTKRTREEGEALVREFRESGMTQRGFSSETDIKVGTLQYWIRRIGTPESGRFVELTSGMDQPGSVSLSVQIGANVTMRFSTLPPPSYLAELSREMRTC